MLRRSKELQQRLRAAKGKLREYERLLTQLEGRLKVVRDRAEKATGQARVRLGRMAKDVRGTLETALGSLDRVVDTVGPRARRTLDHAKALREGVRVGIKTGAAEYRKTRGRREGT